MRHPGLPVRPAAEARASLTRTSWYTNFVDMKRNITIVLDEASARWVRVEAARRDTSVSRYVGDLLARERMRDEAYDAAMARFLSRAPRVLGAEGASLPSREEVHER
jgi:hypothetical protein